MKEIPHTTVVLTKKAQEIKFDLAPIYGLKNILSAGLMLFGKLTDRQQKEAIRMANEFVIKERLPTLTGPAAAVADDAAAAKLATKTRRKVGRRGSSKSA